MTAMLRALIGLVIVSGPIFAQEQNPVCYGPSQALRKLYYKISHGPHKSGVDVRTYEPCPECGEMHDPDAECIERVPVQDCVVGKMRLFRSSIRYEYVVVAEVRYRWKTKWITKEISADCEEPVCVTEDGECPNTVEDWISADSCEGRAYCHSSKTEVEGMESKRIECVPGQTTIKVKYKSCVKEPYVVYRQIKRPIAVKQPCYESVEVPVTRYIGRRLKKDCD